MPRPFLGLRFLVTFSSDPLLWFFTEVCVQRLHCSSAVSTPGVRKGVCSIPSAGSKNTIPHCTCPTRDLIS